MRLRLVFLRDFRCSSSVFWGSSGAEGVVGDAAEGTDGPASVDKPLVLGTCTKAQMNT